MFVLLLFLLGADFKAINIRPVHFDSENLYLSDPVGMMFWQSDIYYLGKDCRLYQFSKNGELLSILGGKGDGPGDLLPHVQALYPGFDGPEIIHQHGYARTKLLNGDLEKERLSDHSLYNNGVVKIGYSFMQANPTRPGTLTIHSRQGSESVPLCDDQSENISFLDGIMVIASEKEVLVCNNMSVHHKFYYTIIDTVTGQIKGKGTTNQIDRASAARKSEFIKQKGPGLSAGLAAGGTFSKKYGFVLTERTSAINEFTAIQMVNPESQDVQGWFVYPVGDHNLSHFLHLYDETWVAYSDGKLVIFELERM